MSSASEHVIYDDRFNEHMTALGHMCSMWAGLEHQINDALWEIANVERMIGACFTAQMIGPGKRGRALVAMLEYRGASDDLLKEVNAFTRKVEGLGARRDRMVHDVWTIHTENAEIMRISVTADRRSVTEFVVTPLHEIHKLAGAIQKQIKYFSDLCARLPNELPPWSRTQYEQSPGIVRHRREEESARS